MYSSIKADRKLFMNPIPSASGKLSNELGPFQFMMQCVGRHDWGQSLIFRTWAFWGLFNLIFFAPLFCRPISRWTDGFFAVLASSFQHLSLQKLSQPLKKTNGRRRSREMNKDQSSQVTTSTVSRKRKLHYETVAGGNECERGAFCQAVKRA